MRKINFKISRYEIIDYLLIIAGSFLTALGIILFLNPSKIAPGGVSGVSTIMFHTFGWDMSVTMLLQNIPLFLIGILMFGKEFGIKSLIGSVLLSVFSSIITGIFGDFGILDMSKDISRWLCCLFGGVLSGVGIGMVMKSGANTGGTDIIAQILAKLTHMSLGVSLLIVDGVIIAISGFIFGIESALYAIVVAYIVQLMVDKIILTFGTNYAKTVLLISDNLEEIRDYILYDLNRSGTVINAKGLYSQEDKPMLMVVIPNQQVAKLTRIVHKADPKAFMIIQETVHVLGEGYNPLEMVASNKDVTIDK